MFDHTAIDDASIALETGDVVFQRTLKSEITFADVGLHTGVVVNMTIKPASADHGIVFVRTDVDKDGVVPALWDRVVDTRMCSVLGNDAGVTVGTVEHLMAALAGCGIDNARIELDNCEVPIMDGSSEPFVERIVEVGAIEQNAPRRVIRVLKEISVDTGSGKAVLSPAEKQVIDVEIDFDDNVIRQQTMSLSVVNGAFCKEL
ncbi:MAG: UDP-3-O-acyl-N-acetylglucosamine deacetylase, partial [Cytophagales bacterium]|nr:UDP-3-O-acyl-N-acetylglucosamine deacetylase [Cytophagales bacterium]